jgi:DNA polymerase III delta' subunit
VKNAATRGQPRALAEVDSMILGRAPHAVMFVGPGSTGKTTLALDLAAGLLCNDPDPAARPCRACRGCHQVASGNHPDLHRLAPDGPGGQIRIGKSTDPEPGTVRHLISELALLPVEGGARVVIVEQADRLNDDAQNALLKMLEEPPAGVTIVLCADDEECLLPTVRSRCARVRVGVVGGREIERWLAELGVADAPRAARLARLAGGRPGLALAYAHSADAERIRGEIARGILDMLSERRAERLASVREMMKSAAALDAALDSWRLAGLAASAAAVAGPVRGRKGKPKDTITAAPPADPDASGAARAAALAGAAAEDAAARDPGPSEDAATPKLAAADRRSAAATLLEVWASIGRDISVAQAGGASRLRELDLVDELRAVAPAVSATTLRSFLVRIGEIANQLDDNVNPELALDVLSLSWPRVEAAATAPAGRPR